MDSLDVKNLFTNVPLDFTIELILNNIFSQGTKDFNGLNRNQLKNCFLGLAKAQSFNLMEILTNKQMEFQWVVQSHH